jgi:hypothetical protein
MVLADIDRLLATWTWLQRITRVATANLRVDRAVEAIQVRGGSYEAMAGSKGSSINGRSFWWINRPK